jgi:hypothetical protein
MESPQKRSEETWQGILDSSPEDIETFIQADLDLAVQEGTMDEVHHAPNDPADAVLRAGLAGIDVSVTMTSTACAGPWVEGSRNETPLVLANFEVHESQRCLARVQLGIAIST